MAIRSIVVGTDGSEPSYRAFAMAVGLAVREQGCVHACFVSHVPGAAALGGFFAPVPLVSDADSDDRLARFVTQELGQASVRGDFTCRNGEVAAELEMLAEERRADLVVVGRSAHPALHLGGVPRQLLAGALPDPRRTLSGPAGPPPTSRSRWNTARTLDGGRPLISVAAVGDNVADIYPSLRRLFPGGNALNVAVAARRAGAEAAYLGAIGTDGAGRSIKAALEDEGIGTDRLRVVEGSNAYSLVELSGGDRLFVGSDVGVSRFTLDEGDFAYLAQFDCIHSGSRSGTEAQLADLAGAARVCFDFSDRPGDYYEPLLDKVWMACFSGARLDPAAVGELTRQVLRAGPKIVLVTEGPRGASMTTAWGETVRGDGSPVRPRDTLGAGDAVIGTVLAGVLRGDDLRVVMSSAMSVAAEVCARFGAFGSGREFPRPGEQFPAYGHHGRHRDEGEEGS